MTDIREQIETLEANGQLDSADTMEKLLDENNALKHYIEYYREQLDEIQKVLGWKRAKDFTDKQK